MVLIFFYANYLMHLMYNYKIFALTSNNLYRICVKTRSQYPWLTHGDYRGRQSDEITKTDKDPSLLEERKSIQLNLGAPHHNGDFSICAKYSPVGRTNRHYKHTRYVRKCIKPISSIPSRLQES